MNETLLKIIDKIEYSQGNSLKFIIKYAIKSKILKNEKLSQFIFKNLNNIQDCSIYVDTVQELLKYIQAGLNDDHASTLESKQLSDLFEKISQKMVKFQENQIIKIFEIFDLKNLVTSRLIEIFQ